MRGVIGDKPVLLFIFNLGLNVHTYSVTVRVCPRKIDTALSGTDRARL